MPILKSVVGIDLNPLAVMAARANYLIAIHDLLPENELIEIPVYCGDSILGLAETCGAGISPTGRRDAAPQRPFDCIAGNPPWIAWDNLPDDYREATKPLWEKYGLFSLSGNAARHGGGKKDLSMLMLYAAADRYLKPGGRLGFVITQTLFQTKGAGDGFRRFRLGDEGDSLKVLRVDDLTAIKPFDDAANWTSTIVLEKGSPTVYPVTYVRWEVGQVSNLSQNVGQVSNLSQRTDRLETCPTKNILARPRRSIRCGRPRRGSSNRRATTARIRPVSSPLLLPIIELIWGPIAAGRTACIGSKCWARPRAACEFATWSRSAKSRSKASRRIIEPDLLYPLLRWSDLARYAPLPRYHLLLVQDCERRVGPGRIVV